MSNCPYVPCGKKCVYEEHAKDLWGCSIRITKYNLVEILSQNPVFGRNFEHSMCDRYEEMKEERDSE